MNKLEPYTWEEIQPLLKIAWDNFSKVMLTESVTVKAGQRTIDINTQQNGEESVIINISID